MTSTEKTQLILFNATIKDWLKLIRFKLSEAHISEDEIEKEIKALDAWRASRIRFLLKET